MNPQVYLLVGWLVCQCVGHVGLSKFYEMAPIEAIASVIYIYKKSINIK